MKPQKYVRHLFSLVLASCLLGLGATAVLAQEEEEIEGSVVQIAPDIQADDPLSKDRPGVLGGLRPNLDLFPGNPADLARQRRPASPYYIGIAAEKVEEQVRAHVDLPEGVGLMVREAFEGSPAEQAGIEQFDILVTADGNELKELDDLINAVKEHSREGNLTQFPVDRLRKGQRETLWVTPAKRPAMPQPTLPGFGEGFRPRDRQLLEQLLERQGDIGGLEGVMPNLQFQPGFGFNQIQGNVSVSMEQENDGPTKVTVQRDGETWEVTSDDPESLNALPDDLRPMVENMLQSGGKIQFPLGNVPDDDGGIRDRIEEMEQQLRQLQGTLRDDAEER